jgi:hypothetical protein
VLIELLVHAVHVGDDAFGLGLQLQVLLLDNAGLLHDLALDLPVAPPLEGLLAQLFFL